MAPAGCCATGPPGSDVDADGAPAGQVSSRLDEEEPVAAPDVENHFLTPPRDGVKHAPSGADPADGAAP
jgi:hypothetical protein